jgi:hypothetical protein
MFRFFDRYDFFGLGKVGKGERSGMTVIAVYRNAAVLECAKGGAGDRPEDVRTQRQPAGIRPPRQGNLPSQPVEQVLSKATPIVIGGTKE